MRRLIIFFAATALPFLLATNLSAQHYTLSGELKDSKTGETLLGANIVDLISKKGTCANEYGFYSLELPGGTRKISVSFIGYTTRTLELDLKENKRLDIELLPDDNELSEIVIRAGEKSNSQVESVLMGAVNLKPKEIEKIPVLLGEPDVIRAVLTTPGITSVGEGATGFNVRGGNIDQNLILLDEAPVYNSSHIWGFFSVFNNDALKDIQLYKGGIPARYGGRASSVLDIRQREGSNKVFKGKGGVGLLFSRLTLEGPIVKDKLSFLVSGRRSYFDLAFPFINELKDNSVYFYDLNAKLAWNMNRNNKLFTSFFFGADVMKLQFDIEEDPYIEGNQQTPADKNEQIDFQWKNMTSTVRWNHIFSDKVFMNLSAIYSKYDYALHSKNSTGGPSGNNLEDFTWTSLVENQIVKADLTAYLNPSSKLRFGANATNYAFTPAKVSGNDKGINTVNFETEQGLELAPYISFEKKWDKWSFNAGLRYSWFGNVGPQTITQYVPDLPKSDASVSGTKKIGNNKLTQSYQGIEPRLSLKYSPNSRKAIKLGYNKMYQYIHLISNTAAALPFDIWKPAGYHIKPLEVEQLSVGYAYDTPNKSFNFSVETYYKTFKNMIEYKNGADLFLNETLETELLPAKGHSYGAELSVHKNTGRLTGNANYTYSVSQRKTISSFDENINNGEYYPSNFDKPHVFNLTSSYKLNDKWDAGLFFTYQSGRPTTYATGQFSLNNHQYFTYSDRNAFRLKPSHRLDASFTYTPTPREGKKWSGSWVFGVYNIYGYRSPFSTYTSVRNKHIKTFEFSVIGAPVPFVTYNFKF
ncbi:MAG: TonB-dependent receptor [Carboxylicivirga sp.]|jgi:hypothetical protein|nr:TonB-dependent receptor [Carboxylicivirga sp.]